jgi:adenylyltransferase/sulfurtransferase
MNRYQRQILLREVGETGQQKLAAAKVLVIGAGGRGCPVLQYLTAAGIGTLGIADGDFVSETNLHRQILYCPADIGNLKAEVAARELKRQNPEVAFKVIPDWIIPQNAIAVFKEFDVVVDCTDQIHTRYLINDACVLLDKPIVYGAIHRFEGQVSVFNHQGGPSYRDLFPIPPKPESIPNCNETGVLSVLPGIIGTMQANEVFKIVLGYGEVLGGKLFLFNAKNNTSQTIKFDKPSGICSAPNSIEEFLTLDYLSFCNPNWASCNTEFHKEAQRSTKYD